MSGHYIQLYDGDKKTLMQSLERIQRTAAEILGAVMEEGEDRTNTASDPERGPIADGFEGGTT